jgi:integrase
MKKGLVSQVRGVWAASGILTAGGSRFALKQDAREQLRAQGVGATSARIAALTPITSYRTYDAYRAVSADFARFAEAQGVNRIQDLRPAHAMAFLRQKLEDGLSCNTLRTYAAALTKFDVALALAPRKMRIPEEARLSAGVVILRPGYNASSPRLDQERRAYANPAAVLEGIRNPVHHLAARLQLHGGFRVSEVIALKRTSLRGETVDPVFGQPAGVVHVVGKGGFEREQYLPLREYRDLGQYLTSNGNRLGITYKAYLADLGRACDAAGETWSGTHALRHCYVRAFSIEAAASGLSSKAVMREAMERVGHHRISELKTYCRG